MTPSQIDQYAVMGNPIGHSKSPAIHRAFAEQTGQQMNYDKILVDLGGLADAVTAFRANNGHGLNITVPFKQDAFELADRLTERARLAGAVNTLVLESDGSILGDNTDGAGLVQDLSINHGLRIAGQRLLLIGAGGAARGVIGPLLDCQPAELVIVNRTAARAHQLAAGFGNAGATVSGVGFEQLPKGTFDLLINASSASLQGEAPPLPDSAIAADAASYDLMYADQPTPFMRWADQRSSGPSVDGLGMLVEQAAESFKLWRGVRPDTQAVIKMLRP